MTDRPKHSHRGPGEGSFYERADGTWQGRVTLRGKRYSVYGPTRAAVQRKMKALGEESRAGVEPSKAGTLSEYLERWLETKTGDLRPSTLRAYESLIRIRVNPRLGHIKLRELTAQDLALLYADLRRGSPLPKVPGAARAPRPAAPKPSAPLSARSVQFTAAVLHGALKRAVEWRLIVSNPADLEKAPSPTRHEINPLSREDVRTLLQSVSADPLASALYALAVTTGMRQGEQLGLKWADVDLEAGTVAIRRTLTEDQELGEVKTARSRRSVTLSALAVTALKRWRDVQASRVAQSREPVELRFAGLVFTGEGGEPLSGGAVTKRFRNHLAAAGLRRARYHDLRHTAATLLLADGTHPKVVQEMLGHAGIAVTLDIYSHVTPNMQREAASSFDRMLG